MRAESRSTSRSPMKSNETKGDRPCNETPSSRVYVSFLPEDIDETQLRDIFQECGTITRIFLKKKEDGFTFAHINFQSIDQARQAIQKLNRRRVGNKSIKVQFGREFNRSDSRDSRDSRDRNDKFGERDRFHKPQFRQDSDTRRRFQNEGNPEGRGRGRGRGGFRDGNTHERMNFKEDGFGRGERGPIKCYKCQGVGHISKNCTGGEAEQKRPGQGSDMKSRPVKQADKMSEDECCDY